MARLTINGKSLELKVDPTTPLLWAIREQAGLTGTKYGCGIAVCGACTVHLDGKAVRSCVVPVSVAEGKQVTTIEGLASGDRLHPIQQKFLEHAALQCGVCTPGFIVATKALLDRHPNPTEQQARFWLAGNLCRCTGYDKILRAVLDAASETRKAAV